MSVFNTYLLDTIITLNSISIEDYIRLSASVKRMDSEYDCNSVKVNLRNRIETYKQKGAKEHIIKHLEEEYDEKIDLLCNKESQSVRVGQFLFKKCLCNYECNIISTILKYYNHYKNGFLPYRGSISEQPALLMEAIEYIDSIMPEIKSEMQKRET